MDRGKPAGAEPRQLTVDVRRQGTGVVISPRGELDHQSADLMRGSLDEAIGLGCARIVIDCSGLEFCDSTGLNVLLAARLSAEARDARIHLAALHPRVARVFDITGANAVFPTHASLPAALAGPPSE